MRTRLKRRAPTAPEAEGDALRYFGPDELSSFLELIDVLMIALPATPQTVGMIGSRELSRLGSAGLLVNVARGPIVKQADLYDALRRSIIAGAAIDVWYDESPAPGPDRRVYPYAKPFHQLPNIVLSPHRGASPLDDLPRWTGVVENISRFAEGRTDLLNQVDLDAGY